MVKKNGVRVGGLEGGGVERQQKEESNVVM